MTHYAGHVKTLPMLLILHKNTHPKPSRKLNPSSDQPISKNPLTHLHTHSPTHPKPKPTHYPIQPTTQPPNQTPNPQTPTQPKNPYTHLGRTPSQTQPNHPITHPLTLGSSLNHNCP